jgi:subtilisin family serine protease
MPRAWDDPDDSLIPDEIFGYISLDSRGRRSVLDAADLNSSLPFHGADGASQRAEEVLSAVDLDIIGESDLGYAVVGSKDAYEELTTAKVVASEILVHSRAGRDAYVTHLDLVAPGQHPDLGVARMRAPATGIEAVLLEQPRSAHAVYPSPTPPTSSRFHLRVPDDVARLTGAAQAHQRGISGAGVTVAMVDTGHYRHPFFAAHDYSVRTPVPVVRGTSAGRDPLGHGTGESANLFAVAPNAELWPYRVANDAGKLVAPLAGFMRAKGDRPRVITSSWGGDQREIPDAPSRAEAIAALEIKDAIEKGIVVVFSAGNGSFSVEPQVRDVIAAGGVYIDADGMRASNYASAYASPWFPEVVVPTLCGLVGMQPRASYCMLPVPAGCDIDQERSAADDGDPPDGTGARDGWALFSGTSAAAPQIAGAAALILEQKPNAKPRQVRDILASTATDVIVGSAHPRWGYRAQRGPDVATGRGLVNAFAAAMLATTV